MLTLVLTSLLSSAPHGVAPPGFTRPTIQLEKTRVRSAPLQRTLETDGPGRVDGLWVFADLTHAATGSVQISMTGPSGRLLDLTPYATTVRRHTTLDTVITGFNGERTAGTWTMTVTASSSQRTIWRSWGLAPAPTMECETSADCTADVCAGVETCEAGRCEPGTPLDCDDGNPCTTDSCESGCRYTNLPAGLECQNGHCDRDLMAGATAPICYEETTIGSNDDGPIRVSGLPNCA